MIWDGLWLYLDLWRTEVTTENVIEINAITLNVQPRKQ